MTGKILKQMISIMTWRNGDYSDWREFDASVAEEYAT